MTNFMFKTFVTIILVLFGIASNLYAAPIDWNGAVVFDTTMLDNYRRVESTTDNSGANDGTQEVPLAGGKKSSSFQSYLLKLNPVLIVNDSASVFAEFTTGYGRGGFMGDSSRQSQEANWGNALNLHNTTNTASNSLNVNKLYAVLYSDTLTYTIGRHTKHWGLGAFLNSGEELGDRYSTIRDGITMELKIGSFSISPYWAKISNGGTLTDSTKNREYGIGILYDNSDKDLAFGLHYSKNANSSGNTTFTTDTNADGTATAIGETNVKLIDIYFRKAFGPFNFAVEFPLVSGEVGNIYENNTSAKYKAKALVVESEYNLNESFKLEMDLGMVDGHSGSESNFEAMYLNPNYQVANILFRYNMRAIGNPSSIGLYDSYIHNAKYLKFAATYSTAKWIFNGAFIYALADETAQGGNQKAFNHTTNKIFTSTTAQDDSLGFELDFNFTYKWSDEVRITSALGYHLTGDYFAYTNDSSINHETENVFMGQLSVGIGF